MPMRYLVLVRSVPSCCVQMSFMSVCVCLSYRAVDTDPILLDRRLDLAHSAAVLLDKHGLIRYDRKTGGMQATDLGRIASHYYVTYQTISAFK